MIRLIPPTLALAFVLSSTAAYAADVDKDGVETPGDCNDADATVKPGAPELCNGKDDDCDGGVDVNATNSKAFFKDSDADGYGVESATEKACKAPSGYAAKSGDCNDSNGAIKPGAPEVCDAGDLDEDCDGKADDADTGATGKKSYYADKDSDSYGAGTASSRCDPNAAYPVDKAGDCNDAKGDVRPGGQEVCDGANVDEDCDGKADDADNDATGKTTFYADADLDKHGAGAGSQRCDAGGGFPVASSDDCNDAKAGVHPGATEVCDSANVDEDCDGKADDQDSEATGKVTWYADTDKDSYGAGAAHPLCDPDPAYASKSATDCNDSNAAIKPGATEVCDAGDTDENCNGKADDADVGATGKTSYYADKDSDGTGAGTASARCDANGAYPSTVNGDCNDARADVGPGGKEVCDASNADEDCDGKADDADTDAGGKTTFYADADFDKHGAGAGSQRCDAGGGFPVTNSDDCDDAKAGVKPGATEVCDANNTDEDCDGGADDKDSEASGKVTWYADADGDTYGAGSAHPLCDPSPAYPSKSSTDCNDSNPAIKPGAAEVCDAGDTDENCNGKADDADISASGKTSYWADKDSDGYGGGTPSSRCDSNASYAATQAGDCNDSRGDVNPGGSEVCDTANADEDCDGKADNNDPDAKGGTPYYTDADYDKHGAGAAKMLCDPGAGFGVTSSDDCDDARSSVHPGATEVCDSGNTDEDCNGRADDLDGSASGKTAFYTDGDKDNYGGTSTPQCDPSDGYPIKTGGDCNDRDGQISPKAAEVCDGGDTDENCNGKADNADPGATGRTPYYTDRDDDNYGSGASTSLCDPSGAAKASQGGDCNDGNAGVNPGSSEVCDASNVDEDCNGKADNADAAASGRSEWYPDADRDGYGSGSSASLCDANATNTTEKTGDCNDANKVINPGASEVCDAKNVDEDCDGSADDSDNDVTDASKTSFYKDSDADGYGMNDAMERRCDPIDGYATKNADCDDGASHNYPGAPELCDGAYNDCTTSGSWTVAKEAGSISVQTSDGKWADAKKSFPALASSTVTPWAAPANSTLYLCPGAFYGRIEATQAGTFAVVGRQGAEVTRLGGAGTGSILDAGAAITSLKVSGVTMEGGKADFGGAIRTRGKTGLTVEDVVFSRNSAVAGGGAVYVSRPATYLFKNVTFTGNTSGSAGGGFAAAPEALGGALAIDGGAFRDNTAKTLGGGFDSQVITSVNGTTFDGNHAQNGGGLSCRTQDCALTGATFTNNGTAGQGAGAYIAGKAGAKAKLENLTFSGNVGGGGGGMYLSGAETTFSGGTFENNAAATGGAVLIDAGTVTMTDVVFKGNRGGTTVAGGNGGAYYQSSGTVTLERCTFEDNAALVGAGRGDGGALYVPGGSLALKGGTIANNKAAGAGGGLYVGLGSVTLDKVTIEKNAAIRGGGIYQTGPGSKVVATGTTIATNTATALPPTSAQGGAWFLSAGAVGRLEAGSRIAENVASTTSKEPVYGGAVALLGTSSWFVCANSAITANTAAGSGGVGQLVVGGGVYAGQGVPVLQSSSCEWGADATDNGPNDVWIDAGKNPFAYVGSPSAFKCIADQPTCSN